MKRSDLPARGGAVTEEESPDNRLQLLSAAPRLSGTLPTLRRFSVWVRIDAWRFGLRREGLCPPRRFGTSRGNADGVSVGAGASLAKRCRAALATAVHRGRRSILGYPIPHQVSLGEYFSEFAPIQRCAPSPQALEVPLYPVAHDG